MTEPTPTPPSWSSLFGVDPNFTNDAPATLDRADRYELALRRLMAPRCENFTRPLGECLRSGRQIDARDGADQACTSCVAWDALYPWHMIEAARAQAALDGTDRGEDS